MKRTKQIKTDAQFVAYYRVSTERQSKSGLGLEAQKEAVLRHIAHNGNRIIAEFTEIESGKNKDNPKLLAAIQLAKDNDATLVIAKLDRLSRNVSFITNLMEEQVKFVACDMPEANEFTIHIFAAMAQQERKRISERIKEAFAAKRIREPEWKPGNPKNLTDYSRQRASEVISRKALEENEDNYNFIKMKRYEGLSFAKIALELNAKNKRTRRGNKFTSAHVWNIHKLFEQQP